MKDIGMLRGAAISSYDADALFAPDYKLKRQLLYMWKDIGINTLAAYMDSEERMILQAKSLARMRSLKRPCLPRLPRR